MFNRRRRKIAALKVDRMILLAAKDYFQKIDSDLEEILQMFADQGIDQVSAELLHDRMSVALYEIGLRIVKLDHQILKLERR